MRDGDPLKVFTNLTPLERKGEMFVSGIEQRVKHSLDFIKEKFPNSELFELAVDFVEYHLSEAIKSDMEQLYRVGYFPATEAEMELDYAIKHALIGSYKAAFADLRRALELTLTNVYLTSEQSDRKKAVDWVTSKSNTPFFSTMLDKLDKTWRFNDINIKCNWSNNLKQIYWAISDYSHNKGQLKGYRELNKLSFFSAGTSAPTVNTDTLILFCDYYIQCVGEIVVMLAIYNPMILVGVPLDKKFGLGGPASGFYYDVQAKLVHNLIPEKYKPYFSEMAKTDEEIKSVVAWVESFPDLTEEDWKQQAIEHEQFIENLSKGKTNDRTN